MTLFSYMHRHCFVIPSHYTVKQNHRGTEGKYINTTDLILARLMCECGMLKDISDQPDTKDKQ